MPQVIRTLLIEDDPEHAALIKSQLARRCGNSVEIEWTKRLKDGIGCIHQRKWDVILLDLSLPDSNLNNTLKEILPHCNGTPIVVLSSLDDEDFAIKTVHQGAQDYLCKTYLSGELLFRSLRYSIERKRIEGELKKAKQAAEAANRAKSAFLANMSHEIRTPLGAVLGFSELMLSNDLPATERDRYVAAIQRNGEVLSNVINDILDLAKVEAQKLDIEIQDATLSEILTDVTTLLNLQAVEKGIALTVVNKDPLPQSIQTDRLRLRQILLNIVGNAIKFTNKGSVEISIGLQPDRNGAMKLCFEVRDTGPGISAEQARLLFEPFSQVDMSRKRKHGGTGLGLALSRRLAQLLGGNIELTESTPGKGSTFTISVDTGPLKDVTFEQQASTENQTSVVNVVTNAIRLDGIRVLLVEDAPDNQMLVTHLLAASGAIVDTASNGCEALAKVHSNHYDILLMDLQMPVMDGYEATAELRREGIDTAIIALTAHALKEEKQLCLNSGFNAHLSKPVNRQSLIESVAYHYKASRKDLH